MFNGERMLTRSSLWRVTPRHKDLPQIYAMVPSKTENNCDYQLSCVFYLKTAGNKNQYIFCIMEEGFDLRFMHSARSGLLSRGLPSGPILAGF